MQILSMKRERYCCNSVFVIEHNNDDGWNYLIRRIESNFSIFFRDLLCIYNRDICFSFAFDHAHTPFWLTFQSRCDAHNDIFYIIILLFTLTYNKISS